MKSKMYDTLTIENGKKFIVTEKNDEYLLLLPDGNIVICENTIEVNDKVKRYVKKEISKRNNEKLIVLSTISYQ